jgi:excisionase family DNA binding protein
MTHTHNLEPEILRGADAIADFLGCTRKAVYHMIRRNQIPFYKLPRSRTVCALRSRLLDHANRLMHTPAA